MSRGSGTRRRSVFTARLVNSVGPGQQPRVLDDLRDAILRGNEPPGTVIPIDAVAAFFGVSQIPVREALKTLLGEGLVDHVPNVGYSVAKLAFAEFRELYEVRRALETSALRSAVLHATADDDAAVLAVHRAMEVAGVDGDDREYHELSRRFHLRLIQPAGMDRLQHMYVSAWNMTEPARPMAHVAPAERVHFVEDHARLVEAFLSRDAVRLVAESDVHYSHLLAGIEAMSDDPDLFRPERGGPISLA